MKHILLFLLLVKASIALPQELLHWGLDRVISFENTSDYKYILLDTTDIWQIGKPRKDILFLPPNSPFAENAIFTDTAQYYAVNKKASFQFKLRLDGNDSYYLHFYQKYDFEPNKDGGIIETSHDNGQSWSNIILDTVIMNHIIELRLYASEDTIAAFENQPGFTGTNASMGSRFIEWEDPGYLMYRDTILLRFSFASDSVETPHEGWLLDEITFGGGLVPIDERKEQQGIQIYPNPASERINLLYNNQAFSLIEIYSFAGQKLISLQGGGMDTIDISTLAPGIYILRAIPIKGTVYPIKFSRL